MLIKTTFVKRSSMFMGSLALLAGAALSGCGTDMGIEDVQSLTRGEVVPIGDTLSNDQTLNANQALVSENGKYRAIMQEDGNFVVYQTETLAVVWAVNQYVLNTVTGWKLTMQRNGNLVLTAPAGALKWQSASSIPVSLQQYGAFLKLDNLGGLTIRGGTPAYPGETYWMSKSAKYEEVAKKFRPAFNLHYNQECNPLTFHEGSSGSSTHEEACRGSFDSGFAVFARVQDHPDARPNSYRITYGVAFGWQSGTAALLSVPPGITLKGAHSDDAQYLVVDVVDDRVISVWADMHQGHYARTASDRRGVTMYTPNSVTAWVGQYYNSLKLLSDVTTVCKNNAIDWNLSMSDVIKGVCWTPCAVANNCNMNSLLNWGDPVGSHRQNQQGKLIMTDHACAAPPNTSYLSADNVTYSASELDGLRNYIGCWNVAHPWGEDGKSVFRSKDQAKDAYALTGCDSGNLEGGDICNASHFKAAETWKTSKQENHLYLEPYTAGSADVDYTAGIPFNDIHFIQQGDVPWRIDFFSGENVNRVQVYRLKSHSIHGGALGPQKTLGDLINDPVVAVELCDGDGNDRMRVGHVKVVTRSGRFMEAGNTYDNCRYFQPPGKRLYGFYGRSGAEIDVLGPIWGDL